MAMIFLDCSRCGWPHARVIEHDGHKLRWWRRTAHTSRHLHVLCSNCRAEEVFDYPGGRYQRAIDDGLEPASISRVVRNRDSGRQEPT